MSDIAIQVEHVSKKYHIGGPQKKYETLRDQVTNVFSAPFRRTANLLRGQASGASELNETIWALTDISLEIKYGEMVGLIGHNGAGKSTLLKILSRITEPSGGFANIYGRVGSLLEVGTGFHPELTGRENVFLNGAILGMKRTEIERKFDEIVTFAEVEKFIDTPVKHYSSGMQLRLAFAVAAHLEPEILIIDEVLAVGDARFQKKCINKMQDVGQQGRTILFVSHNMPAVTRLCERTILLGDGKVLEDGPSHKVVSAYLNTGLGTSAMREWPDPAKAPGGDVARLRAVRVRNQQGQVTDALDIRYPISLEMEFEVLKPGYTLLPHFHLYNQDGVHLFAALDMDPDWRLRARPKGHYLSRALIPGNFLAEGTVFIHSNLTTLDPTISQFIVRDAVAFQVVDSLSGDTARGDWAGHLGGVVRPILEWETQFSPNGSVTTLTAEKAVT